MYQTGDRVLVNITRKNLGTGSRGDESTTQVYWKQKYTLKSESILSDLGEQANSRGGCTNLLWIWVFFLPIDLT